MKGSLGVVGSTMLLLFLAFFNYRLDRRDRLSEFEQKLAGPEEKEDDVEEEEEEDSVEGKEVALGGQGQRVAREGAHSKKPALKTSIAFSSLTIRMLCSSVYRTRALLTSCRHSR